MSEAMTTHPDPERLLQYVDGELGAAATDEISRHLGECAECRDWLNELQTGVADYSRTWMPALKETASAPPEPWFDLRSRMARLDGAAARTPWYVHARPQWAAAAAAVLVVLTTAYWFSGQTVSAAEILRKAADRESYAGRSRAPIRIATRSGSIVRPALWGSADPRVNAADRAYAQSIRVLFEASNYSWEDPLSARSFSAWRASLPDRRDRVVRRRADDGAGSYEVQYEHFIRSLDGSEPDVSDVGPSRGPRHAALPRA